MNRLNTLKIFTEKERTLNCQAIVSFNIERHRMYFSFYLKKNRNTCLMFHNYLLKLSGINCNQIIFDEILV